MSGQPDNLGRRVAFWRGRRALNALIAGLAVGLTACASIDPPLAPANIAPTPVPRPVSAEKPNPERKRLIEAFGGVYSDPATQGYLDGVLMKIAPPSGPEGPSYRLTILNSPVVNAFSLPSGDIFVTRGLLALAEDTSEMAAVMAHEIGHTQGLRDDALADDALMGWQKGVHLRRAEVNIVNP